MERQRSLFWISMLTVTGLVVAFLVLPLVVIMGSSFTTDVVVDFPPRGFTLRWYEKAFTLTKMQEALGLSVWLAFLATGVSLVIGVGCAFLLVRGQLPIVVRGGLEALIMSPSIIPQIVTGVALIQWFIAWKLGFSMISLLLGHILLTLPFVVRTTAAAFTTFDMRLEDAAVSLGATRWRAFWWITLPGIRPGLLAGAAFAFLASFDNFVVTLFLVRGRDTLPIALYNYAQNIFEPTVSAIATVIIIGTVLLLVLVKGVTDLETFVS